MGLISPGRDHVWTCPLHLASHIPFRYIGLPMLKLRITGLMEEELREEFKMVVVILWRCSFVVEDLDWKVKD